MSAAPTGGAKKPVGFGIALLVILALPFFGKGGILASAILAAALFGTPLFAVVGLVTVLCFLLFAGFERLEQYSVLIERIRTLADNPTLLAVPLFIMSGAVMSRGQISARLIEFAKSVVGFIPGGMAVSAVFACILFAAISGSSPATVVAIGGMMGPTLIKQGYQDRFSHGLLTSAGSLGILIPPSIPMILYPIVNQSEIIEVERLFASGFGPGLIMGALLMGLSIWRGVKDKAPRQEPSFAAFKKALKDGFWALSFPVLILGGIYGGIFNAIEAAGISVVYAVLVEVYVHRALKLSEVPSVFQETGIFLGSLLVIMVAALSFSEFLEGEQVPQAAVAWMQGLHLSDTATLLLINVLLLLVGTVMDILSAMFVFVPLLWPIADSIGIDPMHFGIIFIVNLEIGYLTPPVGLNLFVASTLYRRSLGHMIRSVAPFVGLMLLGLLLITYEPRVSIGLGNWLMGEPTVAAPSPPSPTPLGEDEGEGEEPDSGEGQGEGDDGHVMTMEEMMREAEGGEGDEEEAPEDDGHVMTMEEMMQEAERQAEEEGSEEEGSEEEADPEDGPSGGLAPGEDPERVMTMEEMMRAVEAQGD